MTFLTHVGKGLRQIAVADVQGFAASLEGLASASAVRRIGPVKGLLRFAHKVGYSAFDASPFVRVPKVENRLADRIVDRNAMRDLLREAEWSACRRDHAMLTTMCYGGLRTSEACRLPWRHVKARDEGRCQLTVHGKGGEDTIRDPAGAGSGSGDAAAR